MLPGNDADCGLLREVPASMTQRTLDRISPKGQHGCIDISTRYIIPAGFCPSLIRTHAVDVKDLCLGALTFGDASGYDIKKFFENTFSHFFIAGYGSIYPALAELTKANLITARTEAGQGRPDRKVYHLTDAGLKAFQARLQETAPHHKVKSEFLVLMYFSHLLPTDHVEALMDARLKEFEQHLQRIEENENCAQPGSAEPPGMKFVCGFGKAVMSAASQYIRKCRQGASQDSNDNSLKNSHARR